MLLWEFLNWTEGTGAEARADAAGALAKAYLYAELDPIDRGDALRALTLLLDDPSPLVRRALAESFGAAMDAPHHILAALAADRSDIAAIVLSRSPVLSDAELIDAVAIGDDLSQCAVAGRPRVSAALAGAIAEVGGAASVLVVSLNAGADLTDFAVGRMIDRFGADGTLREALSRRDDVGPEMRHAVVVATAKALKDFAVGRRWMAPERAERVLGEACDRATVTIASADVSPDIGHRHFVAYLRSGGHLTLALILRGLLSGNLAMFEAVLCELSGKPAHRVAAFLRNPDGLGFMALYKATDLPAALMPAFRVAVALVANRQEAETENSLRLDQHVVERVIEACESQRGGDVARLTALLRRFEAEAARDKARTGLEHRLAAPSFALPIRERPADARSLPPAVRVAA